MAAVASSGSSNSNASNPSGVSAGVSEADQRVDSRIGEVARSLDGQWPLGWLVALFTCAVLVVGSGIFFWTAWVESHQPLSPLAWMQHVDGDGWFNSARTTATILAIVGVGGAATVGYRRQKTTELSHLLENKKHLIAISAQLTAAQQAKTAAEQLALDSRKYDLDRDRHNKETERDLHARFSAILAQLADQRSIIQSGGLYALSALADDWHKHGNFGEHQVCIDMFCAHLRATASLLAGSSTAIGSTTVNDTLPMAVGILARQLSLVDGNWALNRSKIDLSKVSLSGVNLSGLSLANANLSGTDLTSANLSQTDLAGANLNDANLSGANLTRASLKGAHLQRATLVRTILFGCDLSGADLFVADLTRANLSGSNLGATDLTGAELTGTDFTGANMNDTNTSETNASASTIQSIPHEVEIATDEIIDVQLPPP